MLIDQDEFNLENATPIFNPTIDDSQRLTPSQMLNDDTDPNKPLEYSSPIISPDPKAQAVKLEPKSFKDIRKSLVLRPYQSRDLLSKTRSFGSTISV
jgi:hypothetical protein